MCYFSTQQKMCSTNIYVYASMRISLTISILRRKLFNSAPIKAHYYLVIIILTMLRSCLQMGHSVFPASTLILTLHSWQMGWSQEPTENREMELVHTAQTSRSPESHIFMFNFFSSESSLCVNISQSFQYELK